MPARTATRPRPLPLSVTVLARRAVVALALLLAAAATPARAAGNSPAPGTRTGVAELVLGVEPLLSEAETLRQFAPLCAYLAQASGLPCRVATRPNFLAYWETMRRGADYNLILDDAHFTDYRVQKMGYAVIAKIPGTITYSLIVPRQARLDDPGRLVGRRIATLGIPSMGAALLNGLFPKPSKQPIPLEVDNAADGFALLRDGKAEAAILPTPLVRQAIAEGAPFRVLLSTEPIPHMGFSTAPAIGPELRQTLRTALLGATRTEAGRAMLRALGIERFDPANATVYKGKGRILQEYWGY